MDTIHHLLRLNVEIEGALLVLANRDNEIALRILDEKTKEFSDIVDYLAHPEEINTALSENIAPDDSSKAKGSNIDNIRVQSDMPSAFTNVEESIISEEKIIAAPTPSGENEQDSISLDGSEAESHSIVLKEKTGNENKNADVPRPSSAQKDKIRIDEMLSRKEARNLSKAFTINDRFRFQLHIFDGDKEVFNNTLEVLSSLDDYGSALTYLSGIIDIDTEDQDTADFLAIVQNHFEEI